MKKKLQCKFDRSVWKLLRKIPRGKVATYKQVAVGLGDANAARAVGNACGRNPNAPRVPCHRVVRSDGSIGGYASGMRGKIRLLEAEGVKCSHGKCDLRSCRVKSL